CGGDDSPVSDSKPFRRTFDPGWHTRCINGSRVRHPLDRSIRKNRVMNNFKSRVLAGNREHWQRVVTHALFGAALAVLCICAISPPARAQALSPKIAPDLASAIAAASVPNTNWVKTTGNGRFFKVIVVGIGGDPTLTDLRNAVAAAGGAVNYRY